MLCVFVAGLEFLSEVFVSGVEVGLGGEGGRESAGSVDGNADDEKVGVGNGIVKGAPNGNALVAKRDL